MFSWALHVHSWAKIMLAQIQERIKRELFKKEKKTQQFGEKKRKEKIIVYLLYYDVLRHNCGHKMHFQCIWHLCCSFRKLWFKIRCAALKNISYSAFDELETKEEIQVRKNTLCVNKWGFKWFWGFKWSLSCHLMVQTAITNLIYILILNWFQGKVSSAQNKAIGTKLY